MVWFWTRANQQLQLDTWYDNDTAEFVVTVHRFDGPEETERFRDIAAFRARLVVLERQLETEHWTHEGPPIIIPDGFPNRRLP
jgi:hypothetical protein